MQRRVTDPELVPTTELKRMVASDCISNVTSGQAPSLSPSPTEFGFGTERVALPSFAGREIMIECLACLHGPFPRCKQA